MEVNNIGLITIGQFNNGCRPEKLYHVTTQDRLESILKEGLNPLHSRKQFDFSEEAVYMTPELELCYSYINDLYTDALATRFKTKEDAVDTLVTFAIMEIDCSKLNEKYFDLDEVFETGKEDHEIIGAYTYANVIKPEYIKVVHKDIEHLYRKEEIAECWLYYIDEFL